PSTSLYMVKLTANVVVCWSLLLETQVYLISPPTMCLVNTGVTIKQNNVIRIGVSLVMSQEIRKQK
ncbi:MAG: hypothetical protein KA161_06605, partial [Saprospiraceae bacterium]|nr:hypothetical protein [Saprospiraceae bacterium]